MIKIFSPLCWSEPGAAVVAAAPGQGEAPRLSLLPLADHHLVFLPQYHARSLLFPATNIHALYCIYHIFCLTQLGNVSKTIQGIHGGGLKVFTFHLSIFKSY